MLRILIVDDEPVNREFLRQAVCGLGEACAVESGEQALHTLEDALVRGRPFQVVFMDILMPGMGGLRALEHLRALEERHQIPLEERAPVIVTTSLDDDRVAARAFIQGQAASYLTKPFRADQVLEELRRLGLLDAEPPRRNPADA